MTKTDINKSVQVTLKDATVKNKTVTAVVSSNSVDRDGDIVDNPSLRLPLKSGGFISAKALTGNENLDVPFLINHSMDVEDVIGSAVSAKLNAQGELEMTFQVSSLQKAQDMFTLLEEGHLDNAFSITFFDYTYVDGKMIGGEILEVSLVWRGSNPDARLLSISKSLGAETEEAVAEEETTVEEETETVETETNKDEEVEVAEEAENEESQDKETESEDEVDDTTAEDEDKETNKEINNMTENKDVVTEAVVEKAAVAEQPKVAKKISKNEIRKNFVRQLEAVYNKDDSTLKALHKSGMELEGVESKVLDGSHIYLPTVIADDIKAAYINAGGVGQLVNRVDISGADIFKQVVETSGSGFQAVALGAVKPEDAPVWNETNITPYEWALIVVWKDGQAARTPLAVYNNVVRYIAGQYRLLEDKIILTYDGGVVGSETRAATGVQSQLETAGRSTAATSYASQYLLPALAQAFAAVKSDGQLTLVANRKTWSQVAVSLDGEYNPVFKVVGNEITIGALGTFNVVTSEVLADDSIVVGNFADYTLVTRGDLATLFSQEATVGDTNLFTQNASGLRASIDIAGAATPVTSFYEITVGSYVS